MNENLVSFETLQIGAIFKSPRNGWVYRRVLNHRGRAGRAEFVEIPDKDKQDLIGKLCVYARTSKVIPL